MKKLLCRILTLLLALFLPLSAFTEASDSTLVAAEQEIMNQLLQAMGEELVQRAKDGGFRLKVNFDHGEPKEAAEGQPLSVLSVEIDIRSAMGTVLYKANTVDCDLLAELESAALATAALETDFFPLTEEDVERFGQHYDTTDTRYADVYSSDGSVNLHINETPNNEAIVMLRHWDPDWKETYALVRISTYDWDGLVREFNY